MRRLVWPGIAWLLVAVTSPLAAQRPGDPPAPRLEEPRPAPAFPMALVPFTLPAEWCRGGVRPLVTLQVFDVLVQPMHVLRMRGAGGALLDRLPLRCGTHVAVWNGTIDDPPRLPPPQVYRLRLQVERADRRPQSALKVIVIQY